VTPLAATSRICDWCKGPISDAARRDAITCSKSCRQARHRFVREIGSGARVEDGHARRLAYADPPYPGKSKLYYGSHPDYAGEVDHAALIVSLSADFDAWALSTSAEALQSVLALCPPGVRVASWHRGHRTHSTATVPVNAWEPVIYGGRIRRATPAPDTSPAVVQDDASRPTSGTTPAAAAQHDTSTSPANATPRPGSVAEISSDTCAPVAEDLHDASRRPGERVDSLVYFARPRLTDPNRVTGAKPAAFCRWIFELLGAQPGDELVDVFPGSGGIGRAWDIYAGSAS
jgi:hypothetical protein